MPETMKHSRLGSAAMAGSIATGVAGQVVLVASGVILARTLGPENRGVLALVLVLVALSTNLSSLGLPMSVTYWIAAESADARLVLRKLRGLRNVQLLAVLALHVGLVVIVLEPRSPPGFFWVGILSVIATGSGLSQAYGLAVLQGLRQFGLFNLLRTANGLLYVVGVGGLWAFGRVSLTSVTLVVIVASAVASGATWFAVLRAAPSNQTAGHVPTRDIVKFGLRSFVGSSPPLETFRLDQLLVGLVLPPIALGYYVVALALTNLSRFIGQSIGMVTYPKVAAADSKSSQLRIIRHDFALGVAICGGLTLLLILVTPRLLPFFFGSEFKSAEATARILLVGTLFASLRRILVDGTRGSGRPTWGLGAELLTLLAIPAAVIVTRHSNSLVSVALVLTAANFIGLLAIAPALYGGRIRRARGIDGGVLSRPTLSPSATSVAAPPDDPPAWKATAHAPSRGGSEKGSRRVSKT